MDVQGLADRVEIYELLSRYARGVDQRDWALWRSVFTEDAYLDYRSAGGIDGDRETVGAFLEKALAAFAVTQHFISNVECEIDGDTASVSALFHNPLQFPGATDMSFCGGSYHHRLVRTSEGWKSRELVERSAWFSQTPEGLPRGAVTPLP